MVRGPIPTNNKTITTPKEMIMYDIGNLKKLPKLSKHAKGAMQAFQQLNEATFTAGAIDAKKLGATQAELSVAVLVAAALGAGASVTHGKHVIED